MTQSTTKKESTMLIIIQAVKQIIQLFSGPFLITYFARIAPNPTLSLSVYYMIYYGFIALGVFLLAPLINRRFQMGLFRIGILFNFLYFLLFIFLGDKVVDYVFVVATLAGFSGACYWYPLNLIKSDKIGDEERVSYFSIERIVITLISCIGPILLGSLITRESYIRTAVIIAVISAIQLVLTFFITPMKATPDKKYDLWAAVKRFFTIPQMKMVFLAHLLVGLTIEGVALKNVTTLVLNVAGLNDLQIGYGTSACSVLIILSVALYKWMDKKNKNLKPYFIICGFVPVLAYALACVTGSWIIYLCFFTLSMSLPMVMRTEHAVHVFGEAGGNGNAKDQRGEYFVVLEVIMTLGRIIPCIFLIPVASNQNMLGIYIICWILVLLLPVLSFFTNRYRK